MIELPILYEGINSAEDINDSGQIVGRAVFPYGSLYQACMWDNGTMINLGNTVGYGSSHAKAINDLGQVVGTSNNSKAFIWEKGTIVDLNNLIPSDSGWILKDAVDINNKGQIIGYGTLNGEYHSFLLIPPVTSPPELINELKETIEDLNLDQGIDSSLDAKFENVVAALDAANADNRDDAINKLMAIINAVEAQRGKKITDQQADMIIEEINKIIDAINNQSS